jgi:hypothetical protein
VVPAVPGCLALLQRHRSPALEPLPEASALQLVSRMLGVHAQGLDYKGRLACYELLHEVLTVSVSCAVLELGWNVVAARCSVARFSLFAARRWAAT